MGNVRYSSATIRRSSFFPNSFSATSQNGIAASASAAQTTSWTGQAACAFNAQAISTPQSVDTVPGATGLYPSPNPVATQTVSRRSALPPDL